MTLGQDVERVLDLLVTANHLVGATAGCQEAPVFAQLGENRKILPHYSSRSAKAPSADAEAADPRVPRSPSQAERGCAPEGPFAGEPVSARTAVSKPAFPNPAWSELRLEAAIREARWMQAAVNWVVAFASAISVPPGRAARADVCGLRPGEGPFTGNGGSRARACPARTVATGQNGAAGFCGGARGASAGPVRAEVPTHGGQVDLHEGPACSARIRRFR